MLGALLSLVITFLSVLLSPLGLLALVGGFVTFLFMPLVPRATNMFHTFAGLHVWLGAQMLKRAAIVVTKQGDLLLKRMHPTDSGTEEIAFADNTKEFEYLDDNKQAPWTWAGIPFAIGEEVHGVLFDPRHAALGMREMVADKKDELVRKATESERTQYDVLGWQRGTYEFPSAHELVNLNSIRALMTGIERGEHPEQVEKYYELSREPYGEGGNAARYALLIAAAVGPFILLAIAADQFGGAAGGGGGGSTVSFGVMLLLLSRASIADTLKDVAWKRVAIAAVVLLPLPLVFLLLLLLTGPIYAGIVAVIYIMSFLTLPVLSVLFRTSDTMSHAFSRFLFKLGFVAYDRPVFTLTPQGYQVKEFKNLDDTASVHWHSFLGNLMGFSFDPSREMWGEEWADAERMEAQQVDGVTSVPTGYRAIPDRQRAVYGVFGHKNPSANKYYLWCGTALERFKHVATGQKSHNKLRQAKKDHGGVSEFAHKSFTRAVAGLSLLSTIGGVAVFFL
jgi:hypothetical protein